MSHALTLRELREILGITQLAAAQAINANQSKISRIEERDDLKISTLFDYVDALGGDLEIIARINGVPYTVIIPSMLGHTDVA